MAYFYVPIERGTLPDDDIGKWTILTFDCATPTDAQMCAAAFVDQLATSGWIIWAAVRDCPTFEHMRMLRESFDTCGYSRRSRKRVARVPGYA